MSAPAPPVSPPVTGLTVAVSVVRGDLTLDVCPCLLQLLVSPPVTGLTVAVSVVRGDLTLDV